MNIYLIRHGEAENSSNDKTRRLTKRGKDRIKSMFPTLRFYIPHFDYIVTSPLTRAIETAELIKREFDSASEIIIENKLAPGSSTDDVVTLANSLQKERIAFVGHQPDCSIHLSKLISTGELNVKFSPGTVAKVKFRGDAGFAAGDLEFLIHPF